MPDVIAEPFSHLKVGRAIAWQILADINQRKFLNIFGGSTNSILAALLQPQGSRFCFGHEIEADIRVTSILDMPVSGDAFGRQVNIHQQPHSLIPL